ncbi:MAG: winged helix-turn-helix transcriptional regulator [Candidatus Freyarchaeota archaeon]|mgnify:CR=1 FL=1|nr:helix-turn-helix domain-containing protein [Candidatus Freyarchaeota archaeon]MDO8091699.1 helix-turn-helix domain-containing protein [Candidatus Sigynarchaeota archaeon]
MINALLGLGRSKTRLDVINLMLDEGRPLSASEIADKLGISLNAANIAIHYLNKAGLLSKVERGMYEVNVYAFCKAFLTFLLSTKAKGHVDKSLENFTK